MLFSVLPLFTPPKFIHPPFFHQHIYLTLHSLIPYTFIHPIFLAPPHAGKMHTSFIPSEMRIPVFSAYTQYIHKQKANQYLAWEIYIHN